jgi:environmental stress-induced protein Ves
MQIIRAGAYREVPWKNGGGLSYEIAADDLWRVAIAMIERDGPFSDYRGWDRTIVALDGGRVTLDMTGASIELQPAQPFEFRGEESVDARIEGGPARDLNVMTAREAYLHDVDVVSGKVRFVLDDDEFAFVYAIDSVVDMGGDTCEPGDTIVVDEPQSFTIQTSGRAAVIRITELD